MIPTAAGGEVHAIGDCLGLHEPGDVEERGQEDCREDVAEERPPAGAVHDPAQCL